MAAHKTFKHEDKHRIQNVESNIQELPQNFSKIIKYTILKYARQMMQINRTVFCHFCNINKMFPHMLFDITCSHVKRRYAVLRQNQIYTTFMHNSKNANNFVITV